MSLCSLIAAEELLWVDLPVGSSASKALVGPSLEPDAALACQLDRYGMLHPAVRSYLAANDDRRPRRVSDVVADREWRSSEVFSEVFRARAGRFQLSLVVDLDARGGRGWVLGRSGRDFSDREVGTATALLPLLSVAHRVPRPAEVAGGGDAFTPREREVIRMLSTGLKASAMARALGMSEATARKHLEHAYRKLGTTDRLTTVMRARHLGILD
jgi:DNA-binding CsgD family transcriptional regulator